jgi:hypothetical protein
MKSHLVGLSQPCEDALAHVSWKEVGRRDFL